MSAKRARLFVVSGPSGAGKGTLIACVRNQRPDLDLAVSATTRKPRVGETDGVQYHFLSDSEFDGYVRENEFLEWACVHDHRYGTLRSEVDQRLVAGRSVILEIDVQGALNVRKAYPEAVLVFVEPPSMEVLEERLRGRGTEDERSIELRLANALREMRFVDSYDERLVNDDLGAATAALGAVIESYETSGGYDVSDQA